MGALGDRRRRRSAPRETCASKDSVLLMEGTRAAPCRTEELRGTQTHREQNSLWMGNLANG